MYKFIIWGTGNTAKTFVAEHYNAFFRHNTIAAFADNSRRENQETFFDIPIISPDEIAHYDIDFILIASIYDEEITKQLIDELHYDENKILHMCDMHRFMYHYWEDDLNLSKKRILVVATGGFDIKNPFYKKRFNIIGDVESRSLISIYDYDYDYILLVKATDHKIMETLHQDFNIPMEKILDHSIFALYRDTDIKIEPNQSAIREGINSDQKFLIISNSAPSTGLGAILCIVARNVRYARENGYIPVIDMTYGNQYLYEDEIGRVNAWQKFFLQPAGYSLDDAMKSENLYSSALHRQEKLNDETNMFDFLKPTPQLLEFYSVMEEQLSGKKLLGVLFRGTDYANLKPYGHFIQPTLEQLIIKVKEKTEEWGGFDGVYVCTEVETAIKEFETNISIPVYYYPQKRFPQDTDSLLYKIEFERENDKFLRGAEYFSALLWLSKCDSLVAGLCGGTDAALGLNNKKYKNQYIFSLGRYGIDDV